MFVICAAYEIFDESVFYDCAEFKISVDSEYSADAATCAILHESDSLGFSESSIFDDFAEFSIYAESVTLAELDISDEFDSRDYRESNISEGCEIPTDFEESNIYDEFD